MALLSTNDQVLASLRNTSSGLLEEESVAAIGVLCRTEPIEDQVAPDGQALVWRGVWVVGFMTFATCFVPLVS